MNDFLLVRKFPNPKHSQWNLFRFDVAINFYIVC